MNILSSFQWMIVGGLIIVVLWGILKIRSYYKKKLDYEKLKTRTAEDRVKDQLRNAELIEEHHSKILRNHRQYKTYQKQIVEAKSNEEAKSIIDTMLGSRADRVSELKKLRE